MRLVAEASDIAKGFKPLVLPHHAPKTLFGTGARSSRQAGSGEDFFEYRPYDSGDNAQRIDWRQSARTDHLLVRERERLVPHRVYLYCDNTSAMQFNSRGSLPTKSYAGQRLLLALAALLMQGESQVMTLNDTPISRSLPELARRLSGVEERGMPALPKLAARSHILIVSDFRQGVDAWKNIIAPASEMGVTGTCIQMLDPVEEEFPLYGRVRLESAENNDDMIIPSADIVRPIYLERLQRAQQAMRSLCLQYGWRWISLTTDMESRIQLSETLQLIAHA